MDALLLPSLILGALFCLASPILPWLVPPTFINVFGSVLVCVAFAIFCFFGAVVLIQSYVNEKNALMIPYFAGVFGVPTSVGLGIISAVLAITFRGKKQKT